MIEKGAIVVVEELTFGILTLVATFENQNNLEHRRGVPLQAVGLHHTRKLQTSDESNV